MAKFFVLLGVLAVVTPSSLAFESAKTLPKGVRNINIRTVETDINEKTDSHLKPHLLSEPLATELTFGKIADGESSQLKSNQLKAFLKANGFSEDEVVGRFTADLRGHISVTAPVFAYGITDRFTLALAAPYYQGATSVSVGWQPTDRAQDFLNALANQENNNTASARDAGSKLNKAVDGMNDKLTDNDFRAMENWEKEGWGDLTLAGKYRFYDTRIVGMAFTGGFVFPTGQTDDPDVLNDIAFGDGQLDTFGQVAVDQNLFELGVNLNQYYKYTVQHPSDKIVREQTEEEKVEVARKRVKFKLGDKIETGASLQWAPSFGLVAGVGYSYHRKFGDIYREIPSETKAVLESETHQEAHNQIAEVGFSTVPLYKRGLFKAPLEMKLTWTRQMESRNMPVTDLAQFDLNLFF